MRSEFLVGTELEGAIVGSLLVNPERLYELPAGFKPEHLSPGVTRRVFSALERVVRGGAQGEGLTSLVAAEAKLSDQEMPVMSALLGLSVGNALPAYAAKLLDRRRREGIRAALVEAAQALNTETPTEEVLSGLSNHVLGLDAGERPEVVGYTEAALEALEAFQAEHTGKSKALKTGFPDVDARVRIWPGNLVVLAARPKQGKSTLALNIASFVSRHVGRSMFHSLEMSRVELIARDLASSGIPLESIWGTGISKLHLERMMGEADRRSRSSNLLVNDQHYDLGAILRITEKAHRKAALSLVVVDYLQLIEAGLPKANREAQVSAVSRALKKLAQRLEVPVLAVSQLNRQTERRAENMPKPRQRRDEPPPPPQRLPAPKLHDLRESGAIEQDANTVLFLHHPWAESPEEEKRAHGPFELVIAAQRNGRTGSIRLRAELEFSRFVSFQPEREAPPSREPGEDG